MSANPARWHADPSGRHELRYWDGRAWTAHVSDRGVASIDPVPGADPTEREPLSPRPTNAPRRTQPVAEPASTPTRVSRPKPIVTRAGWSGRTKLLVWFIAFDVVVATVVIWLIGR